MTSSGASIAVVLLVPLDLKNYSIQLLNCCFYYMPINMQSHIKHGLFFVNFQTFLRHLIALALLEEKEEIKIVSHVYLLQLLASASEGI